MKKISDIFDDVLFDAGKAAVVMPLTVGIQIESPEDVIGFAWVGEDRSHINLITLSDRNWEASQDYTGLNPLLYSQSVVRNFRDSPLAEQLETGPVVAFSGGMTSKALGMVMHPAPSPVVVSLPNALATGAAPRRYVMKSVPTDADAVAKWLNKGTPLRIGGRKLLLDNLHIFVENRFPIPKMGWNLSVDLQLWDHVLSCDAVEPEPDEEPEGEDLFQS